MPLAAGNFLEEKSGLISGALAEARKKRAHGVKT
jgi:hypothetical protein